MAMDAREHQAGRFRTYELSDLLPECQMTCDPRSRTVMLTRIDQEQKNVILEVQKFTNVEYPLLIALLDEHPDYCPYAELLGIFNRESQEISQERILEAQGEGAVDGVMRPLRNVMSRVRLKFVLFGADISAVMDTGYALVPIHRKRYIMHRGQYDNN